MLKTVLRLVLAVSLSALLPAPAHAALPDAIQVYTDDINVPGEFGLELHVNTTPRGKRMPDYPGKPLDLFSRGASGALSSLGGQFSAAILEVADDSQNRINFERCVGTQVCACDRESHSEDSIVKNADRYGPCGAVRCAHQAADRAGEPKCRALPRRLHVSVDARRKKGGGRKLRPPREPEILSSHAP